MFHVRFSNFRAFSSTGAIEIKPITILIGENSTGKTSFLAGLRQIITMFNNEQSYSQKNKFNSDPYFLGGFDQIVHYRGGPNVRPKTFSLSLMLPSQKPSGPPTPQTQKVDSTGTTHVFAFVKGDSQPQLASYNFSTSSFRAQASLEAERVKVNISSRSGAADNRRTLDTTKIPSSEFFRRNYSYLPFLFDDLALSASDLGRSNTITESGQSSGIDSDIKRVAEQFKESIRYLQRSVFASAPVRTEPRRTYTPSEIAASSLGEHVPLILANLKKQSPEKWKSTRASLSEFGRKSGLFQDIEIKQLGKKDGDPFQIFVGNGGIKVNLVDVGYGVSQALPIVYQLQNPAGYNAFLLQQPEVHLHPRAQAEVGSLMANLVSKLKSVFFVVETHSDYILDRIRIEIQNKIIDRSKVTVIYFEKTPKGISVKNIYFDSEGNLLGAPSGFRSFFLKEQASLLGL